jgi:hypothetical protein
MIQFRSVRTPRFLSPWLCGVFALLAAFHVAEAAGLPQDVYLWQRAWTEPVLKSLAEHGESFTTIVVLNAEVTWNGGKPQLVQIPINYQALAQTKRGIGLALRVGPYSGPFGRTDPAAVCLSDLAAKLVAECRAAGIKPSELQIDFDCAASKLDGYRVWVDMVRERVAPVPTLITALPSWLDRAEFKTLVRATDGYVLQVHSLERPKSYDSTFALCDPAAARRAVAIASGLGVPFRVALPTYGYLLAFDGKGRFIGLSAEGPAKSWPADARLREVRADPLKMAELVVEWSRESPSLLQGIIWYRFSVADDVFNWRWPTFEAIVQMRIPRKSVRVDSHRVEPGLTEISLVNDGEVDISSRVAVQTRWTGARLMAGDGIHGFEIKDRGASSVRFETGARPNRLSAGEKQVIGWLRLSDDREVQLEMEQLDGR